MSRRNIQLWYLFDQGHAAKVLLGRGDFFIPDITFREQHDRLLVLHQLVLWAEERGSLREAESSFRRAVETALEDEDIETALDMLWSSLLLKEQYQVQPPLHGDRLQELAERVIEQSGYPDGVNPQTRAIVEAIRSSM